MAGEGVSQEDKWEKMFRAEERGKRKQAKALRRAYSLSDSRVFIGYLVDGRHHVLLVGVPYAHLGGSTHTNERWLPLDTWARGALIQGLTAWCSRQVHPISLPLDSGLRKPFPGGTASPLCCSEQPSLTHCLFRLSCWRSGRGRQHLQVIPSFGDAHT